MSENLDLEEIKRGHSGVNVLDVILRRWSPRSYADSTVTDAELEQIFSAGLWAASSFNEQPWRFVLGRKGDPVWTAIFDALVERNQGWARTAPILFASFAKKTFSKDGSSNRHAFHDVGAASGNMSLQATALGLHTHGMAGFDPDRLRDTIGVPDDFDAVACWALGRLGSPEVLPEMLRTIEVSPRSRKTIKEVVFGAHWEQPGL